MPRYSITPAIVDAIAQMEGYTSGKSVVARQNNNPGNIRYWGPSYTVRNGYTVFPTLAEGWAALSKLVDDYIDGPDGIYASRFPSYPSLRQMFRVYAPSGDGANNPDNYAQFVSRQTGVPVDSPVRLYLNGVSAPAYTPTPTPTPAPTPTPTPMPTTDWGWDWEWPEFPTFTDTNTDTPTLGTPAGEFTIAGLDSTTSMVVVAGSAALVLVLLTQR